MIALWVAFGVLGALTTALAVSQLAIFTHFGRMYVTSDEGRAKQGPELGSQLSPIALQRLSGEVDRLPATGLSTALVFASTSCSACNDLKPDLAKLASDREDLLIALICSGPAEDVESWAADVGPGIAVYADPKAAVAAKYGVMLTPVFALAHPDGIVKGRGVLRDADQIRSLLPQPGEENVLVGG